MSYLSVTGELQIWPPLEPAQARYLDKFAMTRRVLRNEDLAELLPDPLRKAAGLEIGVDGEYFVGATGVLGQDQDESVKNPFVPPHRQPSLWCPWFPPDSAGLICTSTDAIADAESNGYEVEWLQYLTAHFFRRWERVISGRVNLRDRRNNQAGYLQMLNQNVVLVWSAEIQVTPRPDVQRPPLSAAFGPGPPNTEPPPQIEIVSTSDPRRSLLRRKES